MSPLIHGDQQLELERGKTLFDYADSLKVRVPTSCGRTGECHECIVEVRRGLDGLNPPTGAEEFLRDNYRLACQAGIANPRVDVEFAVLRRQPRILTEGIRRDFQHQPLTVRQGDHVVALHDGDGSPRAIDAYRGAIYGLAIDIGTTTVVMNLADLENGRRVYTGSFENPQRFGGSDVMHRISYDGGGFHGELTQVIRSSVNFEIGDMCRRMKVRRRQIYEIVIVGNATMRDMFFGLDVQAIGERPYRSTIEQEFRDGRRPTTALTATAKELGVRIHPEATVYGGPLIGSHVGADVAADLLAIGMDELEEPVILIDVGTNTEVVIGNRHRMLAASCPAGPAFEGGQVTYAMPGYEGAVEAVSLASGEVKYRTIGDAAPQGICGSGLIDLLAELRRTGRMSELGVFDDGGDEFTFVPENGLTLSREDVSNLAQAKSANYCGQMIVLEQYGLPLDQFKRLYLAGGFANYVNVESARSIGFVANIRTDRVVKAGNAALVGATIMLLSGELRWRMEKLAAEIEHVELETAPNFFDMFVEGCLFKPMTA